MTAYVAPPYFDPEDYPHYSHLGTDGFGKIYPDDLNHLNENVPHGATYPTPYNDDDESTDNSVIHTFTFVHTYRYLHFAGNADGKIVIANTSNNIATTLFSSNWRDSNADASLSGDMSDSMTDDLSISVYDLDSVDGLQYGQMYHVYDVWSAVELPTEEISTDVQTSWTSISTIANGTILTAATLNAMSDNLTYLYRLSDRPNEPFRVRNFDTSEAAYYSFYKTAQRDYIYYWAQLTSGGSDSIVVKTSSNGSTFGSDYFSGIDTSQTTSGYNWIGYIDVSALADNAPYVLSFDVNVDVVGDDGIITLLMLQETATNS